MIKNAVVIQFLANWFSCKRKFLGVEKEFFKMMGPIIKKSLFRRQA